MKLTLGQMYTMQNALESLIRMKVEAKTAWQFGRLAKDIRENLQGLEVHRRALFEKFGTKIDDRIEVEDDKKDEFQKEWTELVMQEVEIDWDPVSIDELGSQTVSIADMAELSPFFTDAIVSDVEAEV